MNRFILLTPFIFNKYPNNAATKFRKHKAIITDAMFNHSFMYSYSNIETLIYKKKRASQHLKKQTINTY